MSTNVCTRSRVCYKALPTPGSLIPLIRLTNETLTIRVNKPEAIENNTPSEELNAFSVRAGVQSINERR